MPINLAIALFAVVAALTVVAAIAVIYHAMRHARRPPPTETLWECYNCANIFHTTATEQPTRCPWCCSPNIGC